MLSFSFRIEASLSPSIIITLVLIIFSTINLSRASSFGYINGSINDRLVADEAPDVEFLMDSHVNRMLLDPGKPFVSGTANLQKPVPDCDRYKPYISCLPNPNGRKVQEHCSGTYNSNRVCG